MKQKVKTEIVLTNFNFLATQFDESFSLCGNAQLDAVNVCATDTNTFIAPRVTLVSRENKQNQPFCFFFPWGQKIAHKGLVGALMFLLFFILFSQQTIVFCFVSSEFDFAVLVSAVNVFLLATCVSCVFSPFGCAR